MSPHLNRAILLLQQSRPELAEREFRQALLADPNDPLAHAFLSLCLTDQDKLEPATQEAQAAIVAGPDLPLAHLALAVALRQRNRLDDARTAIREAIRLDPEDADPWGELAQIEFNRRDWKAALEAAETGLEIDPEDTACNNMRAMALVKLGRRDEAGATIDAALARDPDDPVTHANQGWTLLHAGEPRKAMEHFREALRLDPSSEWAKAGIVEAMKAKNPLYRWLLAYFLWMERLDRRIQWGVIAGIWFGSQALLAIGGSTPSLLPFILPIVFIAAAFALSTWIGGPLANLLLRLDRFGRHALSPDQVKASNLVGLTLLATLVCLTGIILTDELLRYVLIHDTIRFGLLLIPVAAIYNCPAGRPRWTMAAIAGVIAIGVTLLAVSQIVYLGWEIVTPALLLVVPAQYYGWIILASAVAGNALAGATVRR